MLWSLFVAVLQSFKQVRSLCFVAEQRDFCLLLLVSLQVGNEEGTWDVCSVLIPED